MKKVLFFLLAMLLVVGCRMQRNEKLGVTGSRFRYGIEVGRSSGVVLIDSIIQEDGHIKFFSNGVRITESDVVGDSIADQKNKAVPLGQLSPKWTDTLPGGPVPTRTDLENIAGSGGGGRFNYLAGYIDDTGFPDAGDSVLTHTNFPGKHITLHRDGILKQQHPDNTEHEGFRFNNATGDITVRPVFSAGEEIEIWSTNTIEWTALVPEGGEGEAASPLLDSLYVYYKFNEPSGTVANDEVGSNDAVIDGSVGATGKVGYAVELDGVHDDIRIPYNASIIPDGVTMSVSMLVRFTELPSTTGHTAVLFQATNTSSPWSTHRLELSTSDDWAVTLVNTTGDEYYLAYGTAPITATWYHVVMVLKASRVMELWINNVRVATGTFTAGTLHQTTSSYFLGNGSAEGNEGANITIDEFGFFEQALSPADIGLLWDGGDILTHPFN